MLPSRAVLALLTLITYGDAAKPKVISLDITQESAFSAPQQGLSSDLLRSRAQSIQANVFNAQSDLLYLVNVTVGTPPQSLQLQIDTGSSDIWLPWVNSPACNGKIKRCNEGSYSNKASSSYHLLAAGIFSISYVDNTRITGDYIQDTFHVGGATIPKMTMGLAKASAESDTTSDFEGILGIGFDHGEAYYAQTGESYPNLISQLVSTGAIHTKAYSLYLNDRRK
jgi:Eukaryotic aspartyl protease